MATRTTARPPATAARHLLERHTVGAAGSPLKVDRARGVIYGVKVLGFRSRNNHGLREATGGTEYTRDCARRALPLYEGADVLTDHDAKSQTRGVRAVFGKLRNARLTEGGVRADLHFLKSHPLADRVCDDVEQRVGVYGLSHDATAGRERFDPASRRLVIESLSAVRSVDLVRKPATNRNLWESGDMPQTLRDLIAGLELTPARAKVRTRLLEADGMPEMDVPMDTPPPADDAVAGDGGEDDALWTGFAAAIQSIADSYKAGDLDAKTAGKKILSYLKAHEGLAGPDEPTEPDADEGVGAVAEGCDTPDEGCDTPDEAKTEAVKVRHLEHKLAVRDLCEAAGVKADKVLLESLEALPLDHASKMVEREKGRAGGGDGRPRSSGVPAAGAGGRLPATAREFAASIRD